MFRNFCFWLMVLGAIGYATHQLLFIYIIFRLNAGINEGSLTST